MSKKRFASVWDAIEDTPAEAENLKLRSALMVALKAHLTRSKLTQAQIAKLFGVTQPRVSDLLRGKINVFGLDALVNMAAAAGLRVKISIREAKGTARLLAMFRYRCRSGEESSCSSTSVAARP
jgi:predicted XRE-type DNA-binding protein